MMRFIEKDVLWRTETLEQRTHQFLLRIKVSREAATVAAVSLFKHRTTPKNITVSDASAKLGLDFMLLSPGKADSLL